MSKLIKYLSYILLGLGALLTVLFFFNSGGMIDTYLAYGYILFGVAVTLAIVLPLLSVINNPKSLKKILLSLVVVVVVVGLAYMLASGNPLTNVSIEPEPSASTLKITDTGLIITYFLFGASVLAIVAGALVNMVKNR